MLYRLLDLLITVYTWGLVIYAVLGWFRGPQTDRARKWMARFYEPVLSRLRKVIKPIQAGGSLLDLTPVVLIVGLSILRWLLRYLLPRGL